MIRYESKAAFKNVISIFCSKYGFNQREIDERCILALERRRVAASFALAILSVIVESAEVLEREGQQEVIKRVIAECQGVQEDDSVYIMDNCESPKNSKLLEEACIKATEAVSHAGNLCNSLIGYFSGNMQEILIQARDTCDRITKGGTIGGC